MIDNMIEPVIEFAQKNKCSDIHLMVGQPPLVRHIGDLMRLDLPEVTKKSSMDFVSYVLSTSQFELFESGYDVDTSYTDKMGNRYRVNVYRQRDLPAVAMRLLRNDIPTIEDLRLPLILKDLAMAPRGLVLVTGPTGSGKSTTLAAMIDYININKAHHIITLEDPIEYIHQQKKSMVNQREIHRDTTDFQSALRSALREDPDVILVGEMRDYETISLALTAAETGHLVLSTLHTTGAANTVDRIIDAFPTNQQSQVRSQLSGVLKGVISQALIPKQDKSGRIAVHEIMIMTDAIGNMIRENKIYQINSAIQTGMRLGMQSLEANLATLVNDRTITFAEAVAVTGSTEQLRRLLTF